MPPFRGKIDILMSVRIFTIAFDPLKEVFPDEELKLFMANKRVTRIQSEFFQLSTGVYWTVFIEYDSILGKEGVLKEDEGLNEAQKLLMKRLREWRKETSDKEKVPVFIIATNKQLLEVIQKAPENNEKLREIRGFGGKKAERYGKEIIEIVKSFYENKPGYVKSAEVAKEAVKSDQTVTDEKKTEH